LDPFPKAAATAAVEFGPIRPPSPKHIHCTPKPPALIVRIPAPPNFDLSLATELPTRWSEETSASSESQDFSFSDTETSITTIEKTPARQHVKKPVPKRVVSISRLLYLSSRVRCGKGQPQTKPKSEDDLNNVPFTGVFKLRNAPPQHRTPPEVVEAALFDEAKMMKNSS
jgi:hypothetical protein